MSQVTRFWKLLSVNASLLDSQKGEGWGDASKEVRLDKTLFFQDFFMSAF